MSIIDHGNWVRYKPEKPPKDAPGNAMFARRESDGMDWYDYVAPGTTNFAVGTVKFAAMWRDNVGAYVVGPAVYDASAIFPADHIVGEIDDYVGDDPQTDIGNMIYDPATGDFRSQPPPPPPPPLPPSPTETKILNALDAIVARLEKLEKKG